MVALAETDPATAKLLQQYDYRVVEEFFDIEKDPDNLNNLIDNPEYQDEIAAHRAKLGQFMEKTKDPVYPAFQKRNDPSYLDGFVEALQTEAFRRRDAEPGDAGRAGERTPISESAYSLGRMANQQVPARQLEMVEGIGYHQFVLSWAIHLSTPRGSKTVLPLAPNYLFASRVTAHEQVIAKQDRTSRMSIAMVVGRSNR